MRVQLVPTTEPAMSFMKGLRRSSVRSNASDYFLVVPGRLEGLSYESNELSQRNRGVIDKVIVDPEKAIVFSDYTRDQVAFRVYFDIAILEIRERTLIIDMEFVGLSAVYYIRDLPPL